MPRSPRYQRNEALDKAVRLFWGRGFYATSLKQVEQALDMRPGSLYATFGSKEALFIEALDAYFLQMAAKLKACMQSAPSRLDGLILYIRELASACVECKVGPTDAMAAPACMMVKTLLETTTEDSAMRTKANELLDRVEAGLTELFKSAHSAGELREEVDCERLARLVQTQIMGLRVFAQRDIEPDKVMRLADDMADLLSAYRASPVAVSVER